MQRRRIERYYRWLDRLEWFRNVRAETGRQVHPVHRALRDPEGGATSPHVLHRLMVQGLALPENPRVLDAGCGYGATAFDLHPRIGGDWLGITLSSVQVELARQEAARLGLQDRLRFRLQSYDDPLPGPFDLIIGIESLIHSVDAAATLRNLAGALAPGGWLVIADDMAVADQTPAQQRDWALFRRMWRCPMAPSHAGWRTAIAAAGLEVAEDQDLLPLLLARDPAALAAPLARAKRKSLWLTPLGLGLRLQADIGGMTLECLLRQGAAQYRLIRARKPG